jgi:hypothetical protein
MGISAGTVCSPSVIVYELDIIGVPVAPDEADPPLLVHSNRLLAAPIAA